MTVTTDPKPTARPLPADLADVALLDIKDVCAAVRMSPSWWHEEVRAGRAPQPLRYGPRCTRWTAASIIQGPAPRLFSVKAPPSARVNRPMVMISGHGLGLGR